MASSASKTVSSLAKYKLSRRGKKLQFSDDQRTLLALPKDVPERTWYIYLRNSFKYTRSFCFLHI